MFSTPISPAFLPSNETPKELGDLKACARMARNVYPHWKSRREQRQGKSILPQLNYDETNDNDPYVCFRRRDIRATRKTRRTDNFSIEQFQKLQFELRSAYALADRVLTREREKRSLYEAEKELWEARWKLFETKRRWPSLGMTNDEEHKITGRPTVVPPIQIPSLSGQTPLTSGQSSSHMRKRTDKDREERAQRERYDAQRNAERSGVLSGRSNAPDALKERLQALQQKTEEMLARKKEQDAYWDDSTDVSFNDTAFRLLLIRYLQSAYQPLPPSNSVHAFRSLFVLDPCRAQCKDSETGNEILHPESFRIRRGRGGIVRLDRRTSIYAHRRGIQPASPSEYPTWLFPDIAPRRSEKKRPRSIDEVEEEMREQSPKAMRKDLNETWRYDVDRGGAVGVGMGLEEDYDRVIIDDLEAK